MFKWANFVRDKMPLGACRSRSKRIYNWVKIILVIILFTVFAFLIREYGFDLNGSDVFEATLKGEKFMVEVADTPTERTQGLSGRSGLGVNEGMLFTFDKPDAHGFWMKDMKFPIDIIWMEKGNVIYFIKDAQPDSYPKVYTPTAKADEVLEIASGTIDKLSLSVGDFVSIERP